MGILDVPFNPNAYLRVLVHDGTSYPARPAGVPAGLVRYVGAVAPTTALAGDEWLDTSTVTADTTAPSAVSGLTAGTATTTSVPLSWTAATDNVAVSGYEYSSNGTTYTSTGSTGTSYTVTGLTAGTAYTLYIRAFDAAGNKGTAASVAKTTAAAADATAPSAVTNLAAGTVTATTIPLTWTASTDDVGVTGYEYTTNGGTNWVSTGSTAASYTITGLTASTAYTVQVRAFDAAGNRGASASVNATTAAGATTYAQAVLADAPTLYFPLDEAAGTTTVTSKGSNTMVLTNSGATFGAAGIGDGATAASFVDGTTKLASASNNFLSGATSVTIEALVTFTSGSAVFSQASLLELWPNYGNSILAKIGTSGNISGTSGQAAGTTAHLAVTWDGANARFYKNGALVGTIAHAPASIPATSAVVNIGAFSGKLAGVAVYKGIALSTARILAHAQAAGKA